ncbi:MAG: thioredoxin family protein [Planctomycetota bacterium]
MIRLLAIWICLGLAMVPAGRTRGDEATTGGGLGLGQELFPNLSLNGLPGQPAAALDGNAGQAFLTDQGQPASVTASLIGGESVAGPWDVKVTVKLAPGWHIYSLTQPAGGPLPTKIRLVVPNGFKLEQAFAPDSDPLRSVSEEFGGITLEEHVNQVHFTARVARDDSTSKRDARLSIDFKALACMDGGACLPVNETFKLDVPTRTVATMPNAVAVKATGNGESSGVFGMPDLNALLPVEAREAHPNAQGASQKLPLFRQDDYAVAWTAVWEDAQVTPGETTHLLITAVPDEPYHVYTAAVNDDRNKTNFAMVDKADLLVGMPTTDEGQIPNEFMRGVFYHPGKVTWRLPVRVPADASLGTKVLSGLVAYQACDATSCLQPRGLRWSAKLNVVAEDDGLQPDATVTLVAATSPEALDATAGGFWVDDLSSPEPTEMVAAGDAMTKDLATEDEELSAVAPVLNTNSSWSSLPFILLMAFAGGIILNVMPCVLPVVGLKIMSFVKQAGEDGKRVLWLNLVYVAGILSVFAILAGLAVALSFSWGEQFTYFPFKLTLTLVMFALALSYLGVWEIPVPGMAGGQASMELQNREGFAGAFFKGVFTTILSTPCSGPLLGYILGWTLGLSPAHTVLVIMTVGFGMAFPYIVIGFRPSLVAFLPKPGNWMETLKQFFAFLFLGTVAFFFYGFKDEHHVPVFIALIGVWFGCWIVGLVPTWQTIQRRLLAWTGGIAAASVIGIAAFHYLGQQPKVLQWEPYSEARLQQLQGEGRTVMVKFTAKWCVNCIVNYQVAVNTEPTAEKLNELDAVALYADWTDQNDEIKAKLEELQSRSIPLLAFYPGAQPDKPIVLRDLVSQQAVLDALQEAGPSVGAGTLTRTQPPLRHAGTRAMASR